VAFFATTGVILSSAYALWLYRRVVYGAMTNPALRDIQDLNRRELVTLVPLVLLVIYYGVQPNPILNAFDASTNSLLAQVQTALSAVKTAAAH
jgi:NADH-quinone oxidoreductase subunit M